MKEKLVKQITKLSVKKLFFRCAVAFIGGGLVGFAGQGLFFLFDMHLPADEAMTAVILIVIFIGSVLTGLGIYDDYGEKMGAASFLPISGFANSLTSAAMDGRSEGFIRGIGANIFKLSGCVLLYGVVVSYLSAFIYLGVNLIW